VYSNRTLTKITSTVTEGFFKEGKKGISFMNFISTE